MAKRGDGRDYEAIRDRARQSIQVSKRALATGMLSEAEEARIRSRIAMLALSYHLTDEL